MATIGEDPHCIHEIVELAIEYRNLLKRLRIQMEAGISLRDQKELALLIDDQIKKNPTRAS